MPDYSVLGGQSEATIDQANIAMRAMPWYQTQLKAWGMDPGHPGTLSDSQRTQLTRAAQANGFVVDEGNIEMDDHGNFNPIGHKLRNTIIVIGIAAATVATMGAAGVFAAGAGAGAGAGGGAGTAASVAGVEGGAAGLSSGALAGLGTGAMGATALPALGTVAGVGGAAAAGGPVLEGIAAGGGGASTAIPVGTTLSSASAIEAAKAAGYTIDANGVVTDAANVPPDYFDPGSASTRSYADILKYGLPTAGTIVGSLIAANASGNASAAQQKYLEDALAYEKENDLYNRGVAANKVALEAGRYADYTGRIGGFVANGQSANDRMAALMGLPARSGATSGGASSYSSYGTQGPQGVAVSPELTQRVLDNYKALGLTPTGPGTGPTDSAYFADKYAATGGSNPDNDSYWFGPNGRIAKEAAQAGLKFGAPAPTPPASSTSGALPVTGAPVARALVRIRAADGTEQNIPADQVQQYLSRGAAVLGAGA
jgi:hypothetical protein